MPAPVCIGRGNLIHARTQARTSRNARVRAFAGAATGQAGGALQRGSERKIVPSHGTKKRRERRMEESDAQNRAVFRPTHMRGR